MLKLQKGRVFNNLMSRWKQHHELSKLWVWGNVWSESLGGCYSIQSQNQLEANDGSLQPPDNAKQIVVILEVFRSDKKDSTLWSYVVILLT